MCFGLWLDFTHHLWGRCSFFNLHKCWLIETNSYTLEENWRPNLSYKNLNIKELISLHKLGESLSQILVN